MIENKTGSVLRFDSEDTGYIDDRDNPGSEFPFEHRGARAVFQIGETVTYLLIKTPGTTKAVNLGRPN